MTKLGRRRILRRTHARRAAEALFAETAETLEDLRRQNDRTPALDPLPETLLMQMLDQAERTLQHTVRRQRIVA